MSGLIRAALRGTGSAVPKRLVTNGDFSATLDTNDEWIRTRTGIRERHYAGPGETAATLGAEASRRALAASGLLPSDVDLIVCATITPDMVCPSTACLIHGELGCGPIPAFDVTAACSGFVYAIGVAEQFIKTGASKAALVIGTDVLTRGVDQTDRNTCILFGDAAGAAVLVPTTDPNCGVHKTRLFADGTRHELIQIPSRVTPNPNITHLRMNGREVFKFAVTQFINLVQQGQADCQELEKELVLIVPHQVNIRIIDSALDTLKMPAEKVMTNLDRYGNTSAASIPLALDEAIRTGRAKSGDTILLVAFGGGLTWSSTLITL